MGPKRSLGISQHVGHMGQRASICSGTKADMTLMLFRTLLSDSVADMPEAKRLGESGEAGIV